MKADRRAHIAALLRNYAENIARLEEPENDDTTMFHLFIDICEYGKENNIDVLENMKEAFVHVFPRETPPTPASSP